MVGDGKIVEQGNHSDLIVAGGKYADLWSKQIFIRPQDPDNTPSVAEDKSGILNDLSSEQTEKELSKVKPTDGVAQASSSLLADDQDQTSSVLTYSKEVGSKDDDQE